MTGCCSQRDCEYAAGKYIEILRNYISALPWELLDLKVQNVVRCVRLACVRAAV